MKNYWMFVITGMLLIVTTTGFGSMAYGVILPFMQEGMNFTTTQSGYLGTMLFLGYLLTVGISGILTTHIGAKNVLLAGGACVILGLIGLVFVANFWWAAITLFLAGAGSALVYTPLLSIAINLYPKKRGTVMGLLMSGAGIGMLLSGLMVPFLLHQLPALGWRGAWLIFAVLTLIVVLLAFCTIKQPSSKQKNNVWRRHVIYYKA